MASRVAAGCPEPVDEALEEVGTQKVGWDDGYAYPIVGATGLRARRDL